MRLYNTITYSKICAGEQINYCVTVVIPKLLNSLVPTEQEALVLFLLLCLLCKIIFLKLLLRFYEFFSNLNNVLSNYST